MWWCVVKVNFCADFWGPENWGGVRSVSKFRLKFTTFLKQKPGDFNSSFEDYADIHVYIYFYSHTLQENFQPGLFSWHKKDPSKSSIHWTPFNYSQGVCWIGLVRLQNQSIRWFRCHHHQQQQQQQQTWWQTTPPTFSLFSSIYQAWWVFSYPAPLGMHKTCCKSMGPPAGETHPQWWLTFFILRQLTKKPSQWRCFFTQHRGYVASFLARSKWLWRVSLGAKKTTSEQKTATAK